MFDVLKFQSILQKYKSDFESHWEAEKYKWEAIKHFQDNWNIEAENFGEMFKVATEKTNNLLSSGYAYPRGMILNFSKADDAAVRKMFRDLFDETQDIEKRINEFQEMAETIRAKYDDGSWKNHYQNTNSISTYLWLMFPDKYYIYRYEIFSDVAKELNSDFKPKKNGSVEVLTGGFAFYDEINRILCDDKELVETLQNSIDENCYPDDKLKTMTIDFGYYLSKSYKKENEGNNNEEWFPKDYHPNITVEEWVELLNDTTIFTQSALQIMKRMKDYGGQASCAQLAIKYGESSNFYNSGSVALARRVAERIGCDLMFDDNNNVKWWPILYVGKSTSKNESGTYIWRLRKELSQALDMVDLSNIQINADSSSTIAIWKISHGTERTGISAIHKKSFMDRNVVVVHSATPKKASSKISQGESFMTSIKKGDYFYLCYGNSIQLIGQFTSDNAIENPEKKDGWFEREYRVIANTQNLMAYTGTQKWWTPNDNSTCIKIDVSDYNLFEELILKPYFNMGMEDLLNMDSRAYWWLTANPKIWSFSDLNIGEEQSYTLYNANGGQRKIFRNFLAAKAGDMVIGYESSPVKKVVAIAEVTQASNGKCVYFAKREGLSVPIEYSVLKSFPELSQMEFFRQSQGSLFKLTKGEYDFIMDIIREENVSKSSTTITKYTKQDFLSKVFMTEERYDVLKSLLRNKKNIILQGAPGVGKTFAAKKLAYAMMEEIDDSRIEFVQFHQNYSYEDFIMGYRPDGEGFKLMDGIFYRFCQIASNHPDKEYFFIIDEINRGNMSKIFGELMMLIEKEYRGEKATLAYNGMPFSVPKNLYIIGMMNTADRSLAMIDYALRRRFSFFEMEPGFNSDGFRKYQDAFNNELFNALITQINVLNKEIAEDSSLGRGFRIGHSYFCGKEEEGCTTDWLQSVVEFDILPMLAEYWFDEPAKLQRWEKNLRGVFDEE